MTTLALAFAAGLLSALSPCVLPLLPLVFGAAASESRFGPAALALGVTTSFVGLGLFLATIGYSLGLDGEKFRTASAVLLIAIGLVLALPPLQARLALAGAPLSGWADQRIASLAPRGMSGQFVVGLLLGAVWSPCAGPTLGAASALAAHGDSLLVVAATMLAFGLGAAAPLVAVGLVSRQALMRWRGRLMAGGGAGKVLLGAFIALLGILILTGLDRAAETVLTNASPQWLTQLTTSL